MLTCGTWAGSAYDVKAVPKYFGKVNGFQYKREVFCAGVTTVCLIALIEDNDDDSSEDADNDDRGREDDDDGSDDDEDDGKT